MWACVMGGVTRVFDKDPAHAESEMTVVLSGVLAFVVMLAGLGYVDRRVGLGVLGVLCVASLAMLRPIVGQGVDAWRGVMPSVSSSAASVLAGLAAMRYVDWRLAAPAACVLCVASAVATALPAPAPAPPQPPPGTVPTGVPPADGPTLVTWAPGEAARRNAQSHVETVVASCAVLASAVVLVMAMAGRADRRVGAVAACSVACWCTSAMYGMVNFSWRPDDDYLAPMDRVFLLQW